LQLIRPFLLAAFISLAGLACSPTPADASYGDALVAEYGSGTMLRRYIHGPGVDDPIVQYDNGYIGSRRFFAKDHQGSIVAQTDVNSTAATVYTYSSFGEPSTTTGPVFRYTGQRFDADTGLMYYKARYYAPRDARFLQTDPIGYEDDANLYAYGKNDPLNKIDILGERTVDVYVWNAQFLSKSVGHVMVTEHNSNAVILSQFPHGPGEPTRMRGPNTKLNYFDTFKEEGRPADKLFTVFVDDARFDTKVKDQTDTNKTWDWNSGERNETHCAKAAGLCLKAGGVGAGGTDDFPAFPGDLGRTLDDLADTDPLRVRRVNKNENKVGGRSFAPSAQGEKDPICELGSILAQSLAICQ
jgi:RHS repeat-associated protein